MTELKNELIEETKICLHEIRKELFELQKRNNGRIYEKDKKLFVEMALRLVNMRNKIEEIQVRLDLLSSL